MVSSFTTNKSLEKPANGDYVDTWNVPVNGDMDVIDQALGSTTFLNATGGSATLSVSQYRAMALNISGAMSGNVTYTIPSGIGGSWIVYNNTTDATGGPWSITIASAGGGTSVVVKRGFNTTVYSDGTNIRLADNSSVAGGSDTQVQFNQNTLFGGSPNFVYDYVNARVGIGTSSPSERLVVNGNIGVTGWVDATTVAPSGFALRARAVAGNTTGGIVQFTNDVANAQWIGLVSPAANIFSIINGGGTEVFRIDNGNVGIGAVPSYKLQVAGVVFSSSGGFRFPDGTTQTTAAGVVSLVAGQGIALSAGTGTVTISVPNGGITAAMLASGAAVTNIGYTPANITSPTISNPTFTGTVTSGQINSSSYVLADAGVRGTHITGTGYSVRARANSTNTAAYLQFTNFAENAQWGSIESTASAGINITTPNTATVNGATILTTANAIPVGTRMLFQQTNAPTGWTKETNGFYNDTALRIVTGGVGTGGSGNFSSIFSNRSFSIVTAGHTLTIDQIPPHNHFYQVQLQSYLDGHFNPDCATGSLNGTKNASPFTENTGGGQAHSHGVSWSEDFAVKYVDFIVAQKN